LFNNAQIKPEVNQIELHPYLQQTELVAFCQQNEILITAFSPLGSRHLIHSEAGLTREKLIISIAKKHDCTPAQVLLAWGMQRGISVIPKSVNSVRIHENFDSIKVELDADDLIQVASLEQNLRMGKGAYCVFPDGFYTMKSIWED
jgi:alcohol dehydrogenase (NADP+)